MAGVGLAGGSVTGTADAARVKFTADNHVTIIGGRNIGDEYFGIGPGVEFADMDVTAVGPVVSAATTALVPPSAAMGRRLSGYSSTSATRRYSAA